MVFVFRVVSIKDANVVEDFCLRSHGELGDGRPMAEFDEVGEDSERHNFNFGWSETTITQTSIFH